MFNVDMKNLCASGLPDIQPDVNWGKSNEVGRACKCLGIFWILEVPTLFYFSWNGVGIHVPPRTKLVVQVAYSGKWQRSGGNWQKKWLCLVQIATNSTESSVWVLRQDFAIGLEVLGLGIVCFYNTPTPFKASKHMAILSFPCCRTWHVPRPLNNKSPCAMGHWWGSRDEMPWTSLLMMFDGCVYGQLPRSRSPTRSATMIISSTTLNSPQLALLGANVCTEGSVSFEWICSTHWSCMPQGALVDLRFFSAFATTAATTAVSAAAATTTTITTTSTTATAAATAAAAFTITTTTTTTPTVGIMKNAKPAQSIGGYPL